MTKGADVSLWTYSVQDRKAAPFDNVQSRGPLNAIVSPDGRWVVYQSDETGSTQLFAQPIPPNGAKYQITKTSTTNSHHAVWSRDGRSLFYIPGRQQFAMVTITTTPTFTCSNPAPLPRGLFSESGPDTMTNYDMTRDSRLLGVVAARSALADAAAARPPKVHVVLNWQEELKQRVPGK